MNILLATANRDSDVGEAAIMVWGNMGRQILDNRTHASVIVQSIIAVYGATWNRAAINRVKSERMNGILCNLPNSLLPRLEYGRLAAFLNDAILMPVSYLPEFLDW